MQDFTSSLAYFDTDVYVYHYTTAETAIKYILASKVMRMGPLSTVNDPREAGLLGFTYLPKKILNRRPLSGESHIYHFENWDKRGIMDKASSLLSRRIKVACFARDTKAVTKDDPGYYRGYSRPSMWAYYGGNHTGICLVFDRQRLTEDTQKQIGSRGHLIFGRVRYPTGRTTKRELAAFNLDLNDITANGLEKVLEQKFLAYSAELCLRKHPDWRSENEWRCLFHSSREDFVYLDISGSLRGIVLGVKFDHSLWSSELERIHQRLGIKFNQMLWANMTGRGYGSPQYLPPSKAK